jgi:hypothetical protein
MGYLYCVKWCKNDVSGLPIGPIFKDKSVQEALPLTAGPIGSPETSVLNHISPRSNPEDGRIYCSNQSAFPTNAHHLLHEIFTVLACMFRSHGQSSGQLYNFM